MARYIDADALKLDIDLSKGATVVDMALSVIKAIQEAPATDVVEVVRCKDCKWWTKQEDSSQGRCVLLGIYPTGAWYCGNGTRKEVKK